MVRLSIRNGLVTIIVEPSVMVDTAAVLLGWASLVRGLLMDVDDSEFSSSDVFSTASLPVPPLLLPPSRELQGEKLSFVASVDGVAPQEAAKQGARRFRPLHERCDAAGELTSGEAQTTVLRPRGCKRKEGPEGCPAPPTEGGVDVTTCLGKDLLVSLVLGDATPDNDEEAFFVTKTTLMGGASDCGSLQRLLLHVVVIPSAMSLLLCC